MLESTSAAASTARVKMEEVIHRNLSQTQAVVDQVERRRIMKAFKQIRRSSAQVGDYVTFTCTTRGDRIHRFEREVMS